MELCLQSLDGLLGIDSGSHLGSKRLFTVRTVGGGVEPTQLRIGIVCSLLSLDDLHLQLCHLGQILCLFYCLFAESSSLLRNIIPNSHG